MGIVEGAPPYLRIGFLGSRFHRISNNVKRPSVLRLTAVALTIQGKHDHVPEESVSVTSLRDGYPPPDLHCVVDSELTQKGESVGLR